MSTISICIEGAEKDVIRHLLNSGLTLSDGYRKFTKGDESVIFNEISGVTMAECTAQTAAEVLEIVRKQEV